MPPPSLIFGTLSLPAQGSDAGQRGHRHKGRCDKPPDDRRSAVAVDGLAIGQAFSHVPLDVCPCAWRLHQHPVHIEFGQDGWIVQGKAD